MGCSNRDFLKYEAWDGVHGNGEMGECFCREYGNMGIWEMSDIEYDTQLTNAISLAGI